MDSRNTNTMLTKQQKSKYIEEGKKFIQENKTVVFADFTGLTVGETTQLRRILKDLGGKMKVIKKKLMRIAFERSGMNFNPEQFESQTAMLFAPSDISEIAGPVYKFGKDKDKEKRGFKILGAYDLSAKNFFDAETVKRIGQLPPREVLLGQLVGMLAAPIKMFMFALNEKGRKEMKP